MGGSNNVREELRQTAEMLEQILEVMPDDLVALRALYETALKLEQPEKALDTLTRMDDVARSANNEEVIAFVLNQYLAVVGDMPQLQRRIDRLMELQMMTSRMNEASPLLPAAERKSGIEPEMALAWELFQDEVLTQQEYSTVVHDLAEMSSREVGVPVTVLHVLHDRNFSRFERLMTHLCQKSGVPVIALGQFSAREDLRTVLPLNFISQNGALPFSSVEGDLLLAVLNPMDKDLVRRAGTLAGRRCHPYLVTSQEYDQRLAEIKAALA